jgi:Ca2+-binding EF-hand superfamily protein
LQVGPRVAARDPGEDAARAFSYIDVEGKGFINHDDLRRVAERVSTIDQMIEDPELAAMLDAADMDGDGIITNEEFFDIAFD